MKKILFILIALFVLSSCIKEPEYQSHQIEITIGFPEDLPSGAKSGAKVTLFNQLKSYSLELYSNEDGKVVFSNVESGLYSVTIAHSNGTNGVETFFNGFEAIEVFNSINKFIKVNESRSNAFVIKEFYYSGSLTPAGNAYFSDQYIELYNNSSSIQYAGGISVLEHESYGLDVNFWKNIKDTIVVKMIWTIPGTDLEQPVLPGQSIILAVNGINHKSDPKGNPLSPVDLGNAEFEFFVLKDPPKDTDSPNVPNLEEDRFVFRANDANFHVGGGSAIAIARIPGKNQQERMQYINKHLIPKKSASGSNTTYYPKIANNQIIDAIEVVLNESNAIYKRFPVELDAGYTYVPSGSKSGKCIRRKIIEIRDGRVIYQDTNNSTEDFLKDVYPKPKIYAE